MKRLLTLLLFSNLLLSLLQAQPVHQIRGTVIEKNSRQPLEFINVMVRGLNKGGVPNAEGHFTIEQVPPGIYRLQACLLYTSDAADEEDSVDLGGRRILKKKYTTSVRSCCCK